MEEKSSVKFHFAKLMEAIGLPVQNKLFLYAAYETSNSDKQQTIKKPFDHIWSELKEWKYYNNEYK